MVGSPIVTVRLPKGLSAWFDAYKKQVGVGNTEIIRGLIEAISDHRLLVLAEPCPALINDGTHPDSPVQVCLNTN